MAPRSPRSIVWCMALLMLGAWSPGLLACTARALPLASLNETLGLRTEGHVTQAWACKDASGDHVLMAARLASPNPQLATQLSFVKQTRTPSGWKKDWQARDFLAATTNLIAPELMLIKDVDGDSLADVFIAYTLPGPDKTTDEGKLLVFYKDKKYAIRGVIARTPDDFGSRKVSDNFLTLPQPIQAQALQLWDKLSTPANRKKAPGAVAGGTGP